MKVGFQAHSSAGSEGDSASKVPDELNSCVVGSGDGYRPFPSGERLLGDGFAVGKGKEGARMLLPPIIGNFQIADQLLR